jgi:predicted esterase
MYSVSSPDSFRLLHFPQALSVKSARCIVWLHGIGERGDDLSLVSRYGLPAALNEGRLTVNADVICPQLEAGLTWSPERLAYLLAELRKQYEASALLGYSLGADGVCELLAHLGSQASMHIAIAPSASAPIVASQAATRFLTISGEYDPWLDADVFLRAVRASGGDADRAVMQGEGHYISESALTHPKLVTVLASIGIAFVWC